ncbi:MAG: hypothetical protein DHS20C02_01490 [Micavibrio sp.]|nr:MAG: hypothetical protein DHS20C02_01490 [Micavibrio sp.]
MSGPLLSIVLDIVVLIFLGMTIYYAMRLSKSLNNFRVQRNEMKNLVAALAKNIDQANSAIAGLKAAGNSSGEKLQGLINESITLSDELQLMNEAGNNLAKRLENLAEGSSARSSSHISDEAIRKSEPDTSRDDIGAPFLIQDRDFEQPFDGAEGSEESSGWGDEDIDLDVPQDMASDLHSRAERELFQALQKNLKKKSSGGGA